MLPFFLVLVASCGVNFCANDTSGHVLYNNTDFATVLQNTINIPSVHQVQVQCGDYYLSDQIKTKSNLDLHLCGNYTVNYVGTNSHHAIGFHIFYNNTNVSISGPARIDGNSKIQDKSVTQALILTNNGSNHIILRDLNLTNSVNWPLNSASHDILVDHVDGSYSGNGVIFATDESYNVIYQNSIVHDIPNDWGIIVYGGSYNVIFNNDIAYKTGYVGIGALSDQWRPMPSHDVLIENSISYDNNYSGFGAAGYNAPVYNIQIQNNISEFNNRMNGWAGYGGYEFDNVENVQAQNNLSYENGNGNSGASGFSVYHTNYVTISNNKCINEGQGSHNGFCVLEFPFNNGLIVHDNQAVDNQTNPTMTIGYNFLSPTKPTDTSAYNNYASPNIPYNVYTPGPNWLTNDFNNFR